MGLIVVIAASFRMVRLGSPDFGGDELAHVFAAMEMAKGHPPTLPSGFPYDRDILYTTLLAGIAFVVGLNEWSARLPSVVFGVGATVLVFVMGRRWYSTSVGLVAAFVIAASPIAIEYSREVRAYAMLQFLYLSFIYLSFIGYESANSERRKDSHETWYQRLGRAYEVRPMVLIAACILFLTTVKVHKLIIPSMSGPLAYVMCMTVAAVWSETMSVGVRRKYIFTLVATGIGAVLVYLFSDETVRGYIALTQRAPTWAQDNVDRWDFYIRFLLKDYPVVFATLGIVVIPALAWNIRAGVFLMCCFAVPLLLHSYVFAWKSYRYILHLLPVMFILWSAGFCSVLAYVRDEVVKRSSTLMPPARARMASIGLVTLGMCFMLVGRPWFMESLKVYAFNERPSRLSLAHCNWNAAMKFVSNAAKPGDVLITSLPLLAVYYGPRMPLYSLNNNILSLVKRENLKDEQGRALEYTAGAPVITDVDDLWELIQSNPSGWFVGERFRFYSDGPTPREMRRFIERHLALESVSSAEDMVVWRWNTGQALDLTTGRRTP